MNLRILDGTFSVCRLKPSDSIPEWVYRSSFYSISKSKDELSIVCESNYVPEDVKSEKNWNLIKVKGPLDFNLTGIFSSLTKPLAEDGISIFAISTFDTDYLLVKAEKIQDAKVALEKSGFKFE